MRTHYAGQVDDKLDGKTVKLAGWVHETRDLGGILFILLRDRTGISQLTIKKKETPELAENAKHFVKETAIMCEGKVTKNKQAPKGVEIHPTNITMAGKVYKKVPLDVTDKVPAEIDTRLDARFIDLRRAKPSAIMRVRATAQSAFREKLMELGCQEINPPTIVSTATEGGADLFHVQYFEKDAFLAQSPQLYKQLALVGGMDRVFMITTIFRAEKHNTTTHLNEVTQMDAEISFTDDEGAMDVLEKTFLHILEVVSKERKEDLKLLESEVKPLKKIKRFTYDHVLEKLKGEYDVEWGHDFPKEAEQKMPSLLGEEAFFITKWPTQVRAFYSMPFEDEPKKCRAFDLMYKGLEISSGAQRIHDPELLVKALKTRGLNPEDFESYVDAFRYGAPPHAGWSIGSERLTMQLTGQKNIRECALFPRDRHRLLP
ncbi:aspartate--tRNA(Asn) ligase [Candidatus Micrarchaeota archaeon]|nr:aspartate--tRNA(Asn) ligase [Candidatus Micrarchaeota archaeon]